MENLKQVTELERKVLLTMANRENPYTNEFRDNIEKAIQKDQSYTNDFLNYMCECRLLTGKDGITLPRLTPSGMQLAQDIGNDEIWDEAIKICNENQVYSLNSVMYAVTSIIRRRIDASIERQ